MSPRRLSPTATVRILPGDHNSMTPPQKRTHYAAGCRHEDCRAARSDWDRQKKEMRADLAAKRAPAPTPPAEPDAAPEPTTTLKPAPAPPAAARMPALGAARRLQGLVFAGHSPVEIASATRIGVDEIWWLLLGQFDTVSDTTHRIIDREFKRLRTMTPEPRAGTTTEKKAHIARAQNLAAAQGWVSAFDWEWIDTDPTPKHHGRPGAGTAHHEAKTSPAVLDAPALEKTPETPSETTPPATLTPAQPSATALAAVRQLRALANAAEAAAEALEGGL
jgi:hypothetical protein